MENLSIISNLESGFETPLSTQFACSLCDFETVQEEEIKTHMESHEICMVFSCKHCHFQVNYLFFKFTSLGKNIPMYDIFTQGRS